VAIVIVPFATLSDSRLWQDCCAHAASAKMEAKPAAMNKIANERFLMLSPQNHSCFLSSAASIALVSICSAIQFRSRIIHRLASKEISALDRGFLLREIA